MGCTQSKIEKEEAVVRCKDRKQRMGDAVASRNAFAAAHSAYTVSLKSTGAAFSDFAQGEAPSSSSSHHSAVPSSSSAAAVQPPIENLPPPPPPLPDFSPSPLHRSTSMPDLPIPNPKNNNKKPSTINEEEDDDADEIEDHDGIDPIPASPPPVVPNPKPTPSTPPPPPPMPESKGIEDTWEFFFGGAQSMPGPSLEPQPELNEIKEDEFKGTAATRKETVEPPVEAAEVAAEKVVVPEPPKPAKKPKHQHAVSAGGALESKKGKMVVVPPRRTTLLQVLTDLDDHFLKAYHSAHDVSKMLEATRLHYHSNFADNRGHIDHSAIVMQVITWNRSLKGIPKEETVKDDFDSDEYETHATILDKMLAWEKKLYDEVKAGELMKVEYQKKVSLLNKQKKHVVNPEVLEKTKSAVSHLHTRYIVDMQSMDSTVSEINRLRDDRLYPKLVELVDGMKKMWEAMYTHHKGQLVVVADLRALDVSLAPKETSDEHHKWTGQLYEVLGEWHRHFQKLMAEQKAYIKALNGWLKLNLIPIESSLKEKVSSPPRVVSPPIEALIHSWLDHLEKLPDELASGAIYNFSEVIRTILIHQEDELKLRDKCEESRREYMRKARAFEDWHQKYLEKRAAVVAAASEGGDLETAEGSDHQDPVVERKFVVEAVKLRLESEVEAHQKLCKQVREKSLGSLKTHLPELFRAITEFSHKSSEMYARLMPVKND